jgi:nucleotide-binding universal stress UspA family protein
MARSRHAPGADPDVVQPLARARRILLADDQSSSSRAAAAEAIRRAAADSASLIVLSVAEPSSLHLPGHRPQRLDQEHDRLEAGAVALVRLAREAGVDATWLIWDGEPAETILEASRSEEVDLIVLGSRRRTNLKRLILGSVSSVVARAATCEVVVVPG